MVCAFGVSNYLMGLEIKESANFLHMPTNIKFGAVYTILIYGICLLLKTRYIFIFTKQYQKEMSKSENSRTKFYADFLINICAWNLCRKPYLLYEFEWFYDICNFHFVLFLRNNGSSRHKLRIFQMATVVEWAITLDKYEYREDFESVIKSYRQWIERYINSLSNSKLQYIKDKMFNLQLKISRRNCCWNINSTIFGLWCIKYSCNVLSRSSRLGKNFWIKNQSCIFDSCNIFNYFCIFLFCKCIFLY